MTDTPTSQPTGRHCYLLIAALALSLGMFGAVIDEVWAADAPPSDPDTEDSCTASCSSGASVECNAGRGESCHATDDLGCFTYRRGEYSPKSSKFCVRARTPNTGNPAPLDIDVTVGRGGPWPGTCSVDCDGGGSLMCSGTTCNTTPGVGCKGLDESGAIVDSKLCITRRTEPAE